MKRRLKRTTSQYITVSLISVIIIGAGFMIIYFTVIQNIKVNYQKQIKLLTGQLESNTVYVYKAAKDIPVGSKITKDDLKYIQAYSNQSQDYFMTKEDIGKVTIIDIAKETQVLKGMLTEDTIEDNVREVEYNSFLISSNLNENDYVDIRILFPNGEDYIVLSKKSIKNLSLETSNCFLWLTEEEILYMSGAIVDAYLFSGSKLYTTKYIEPNLQEASIPTYQPSLSTLLLIEQDENIVNKASKELNKQLRRELENRLMDSSTSNEGYDDSKQFNTDSNQYNSEIDDTEQTVSYEKQMNQKQVTDNLATEDYFNPNDSQSEEELVEYGE